MKLHYFQYQAYDSKGQLVADKINAVDEHEALSLLKNRKLTPVKIEQIKSSSQILKTSGSLSSEELINFTEGLNTLIKAQVPIDKALILLKKLSDSEQTQLLVESMIRTVKEGGTLAQAMEDNQHVFSKMYISMIRAGEEGGILAELLPSLKQFLLDAEETKRQLLSAMIYPAVLLTVGLLSIILMIVFVVPQFASLFTDSSISMPASAAFLFAMSDWLQSYAWTFIPLLVSIFVFFQWWEKDEQHRKQKDSFLLTLPIIGKLLLYKDASSFCRTIGALLGAGIPLIKSLNISQGVLENTKLAAQLILVEEDVKSGISLGKSLEKNTDFPGILPNLVIVGEETGKTAQTFDQLADNLNRSVKNRLEKLLALIEPLLILLLGVLIGGIVIIMLLAVFSMNDISM